MEIELVLEKLFNWGRRFSKKTFAAIDGTWIFLNQCISDFEIICTYIYICYPRYNSSKSIDNAFSSPKRESTRCNRVETGEIGSSTKFSAEVVLGGGGGGRDDGVGGTEGDSDREADWLIAKEFNWWYLPIKDLVIKPSTCNVKDSQKGL